MTIAMPDVFIGRGVGSGNWAWRLRGKTSNGGTLQQRGLGIHHAAAHSDIHAVCSGVIEEIKVDGENSVV